MIALPTAFNAATYFVDRNVREGRGAKTALGVRRRDESVTSNCWNARTSLATSCASSTCAPGNGWCSFCPTGRNFCIAFLARSRSVPWRFPSTLSSSRHEYEYVLNDTQARVVVVSDALVPQLRSIPQDRLRYLREIVVVGERSRNHLSFQELVSQRIAGAGGGTHRQR